MTYAIPATAVQLLVWQSAQHEHESAFAVVLEPACASQIQLQVFDQSTGPPPLFKMCTGCARQ